MVKLAPSLLSANFSRLAAELDEAEQAGIEILHLDVMDGHFVPNITFGPGLIGDLRPLTKMAFDVHLMIENPENYIDQFVRAGADGITVHAEGTVHLHRLLTQIREKGVKAAVALNPSTPLSAIEWVLPQLDMILLMTVNPGYGGQKFIPQVLNKISMLKNMLDQKGLSIPIQVDGGINRETAAAVVDSGATILVAGSAIFGQPDIAAAIEAIMATIQPTS